MAASRPASLLMVAVTSSACAIRRVTMRTPGCASAEISEQYTASPWDLPVPVAGCSTFQRSPEGVPKVAIWWLKVSAICRQTASSGEEETLWSVLVQWARIASTKTEGSTVIGSSLVGEEANSKCPPGG